MLSHTRTDEGGTTSDRWPEHEVAVGRAEKSELTSGGLLFTIVDRSTTAITAMVALSLTSVDLPHNLGRDWVGARRAIARDVSANDEGIEQRILWNPQGNRHSSGALPGSPYYLPDAAID